MGIFFNKKEDNKIALVFDMGSASVGGAMFEVDKNGRPAISFSTREPIIFEGTINPENFLKQAIKSLDIVASRICMQGLGKPFKIFCILSSPWYASQARVIKFEKNTSFIFTSKLADELIAKEIKLFQEEISDKYSNHTDPVRPIEFKSIKTVLNGYPTSEPFDKKIKKLEMSVFISMSHESILKKMEEVVFRHFHVEDIKFSSFAMTSFSVIRDLFAEHKDFLLVDVAGEMTDISMVKNDVLQHSVSYPLGRNFILRGIADGLKCTLSEAKSLLSIYKDNHAEQNTENNLRPIIEKLKNEWLSKFQESLVNLSDSISVPATIFMIADPDLVMFFSDIIQEDKVNQYNLTESKFKVVTIDNKIFHNLISFTKDAERDTFLILESIYLNRFIC